MADIIYLAYNRSKVAHGHRLLEPTLSKLGRKVTTFIDNCEYKLAVVKLRIYVQFI